MTPTTRRTVLAVAAAVFVGTVLAANYATSNYGLLPVGFGLTATAGTYFAGLAFVARDTVQDLGGRVAVVLAIIAGAALSYLVADPFIATASAVAFLLSETADACVYTPLRSRGYLRAAVASNVVGAAVDTVVFLWIAGFPFTAPVVEGQMLAKVTITAAAALLVIAARASRSSRVTA